MSDVRAFAAVILLLAGGAVGYVARGYMTPAATTPEQGALAPKPRKDSKLVEIEPGLAETLGIRTVTAAPANITRTLLLNGAVGLDGTRNARVTARTPGQVRELRRKAGDRVAAGEVLALLDSPEVADARTAVAAAQRQRSLAQSALEREKALYDRRISTERDYIAAQKDVAEADAAARQAQAKLAALGGGGSLAGGLYAVTAPAAGEIVEVGAVPGEFVRDDRSLFQIADFSIVSVMADAPPDTLDLLRPGAEATILADGRTATGRIAAVLPTVSDETRSGRVRIELANDGRAWRPGTFVTVKVSSAAEPVAVAVPKDAVQVLDGQTVVFRAAKAGFRLQPVRTGRADADWIEIAKGLKVGEAIAGGQTFLLKAELTKGGLEDDDD